MSHPSHFFSPLLLLLSVLIAACALPRTVHGDVSSPFTQPPTTPPTTHPPFDGYFEVLHAAWGSRPDTVQLRYGLKTWAKYINDNNGIEFGTLGKRYGVRVTEQLAEVAADLPALVSNVAEKLDSGEYDLLVMSNTLITTNMSVIANDRGVLLIDPWQSSVSVDKNPANGLPWKLRFSLSTDSSTRAVGFVRVSQQRGCTRLGLLNTRAMATEYADLMARGVRETAASIGLDIVYDVTDDFNDYVNAYNFTTYVDMARPRLLPVLQALREKRVQCFVAVSPGAECITLQRMIAEHKIDLLASFSPQGPQNPLWAMVGAESGQYIMSGIMWSPTMKYTDPVFGSTQNFVKLHNALWNTTNAQSAVSALAGVMFTLGLRGVHKSNQYAEWVRGDATLIQQLAASIGDIAQETFFGFVKFNRYNHNTGTVDLTVQLINGTNVVVLPQDVATRPPILPIPSWQSRTATGCPPGTYNDGFRCAPCPAEHYSDTHATTACLPCPVGTGQPLNNQTKCLPCAAGTYSPSPGLGCLKCQTGTFQTAEGATRCDSCPAGTYTDTEGNSECTYCPAGTFTSEIGSSKCRECVAGFFRPASKLQTDGQACTRCPYGFYQSNSGSDSCLPCPNGRTTLDTGSDGLDTCVCADGMFWNRKEDVCARCSEGVLCEWSKMNQGMEMTAEGKDWVNMRLKSGITRRLEGSAAAKYTRPVDFSSLTADLLLQRLTTCYGDAECPPGLGLPAVAPGYYAEKIPRADVANFTGPAIFECTDILACPGGSLAFSAWEDETNTAGGLCTKGRTGIACSRCHEGWTFDKKDKICKPCTDSDRNGPLIGVALCLFFIAPILYVMCNLAKPPGGMASVRQVECEGMQDAMHVGCILLAQMISFAQGLNVLGTLSVDWEANFYAVSVAMKFVRFDFDFVIAGCALQDTARQYAFVVFLPLMVACSCLVWLLLSNAIAMSAPYRAFQAYVKRIDTAAAEREQLNMATEQQQQETFGRWLFKQVRIFGAALRSRLANGAMDADRVFNTIAFVISAFYVSVCANCLVPAHALQNPSGSKTLQRYPHIVYGSDEWSRLLAVGVTGLVLYIGCWLPHLIWAAYVAPDRLLGSNGARFMNMYSFLLPAYRPECWWWGVALVVKSLLVAVMPIMGFGDGQMQATLMVTVFGSFAVAHMKAWPYKSFVNNFMEGCLTFLLMLISAIAIYYGIKIEEDYDFFAGYVTTLLVFALIVLLVGIKLSAEQYTRAFRNKQDVRCQRLTSELKDLTDMLACMEDKELYGAVKGMGVYDRLCLEKACLLYRQEILMLRDGDDVMPSDGTVANSITEGTAPVRQSTPSTAATSNRWGMSTRRLVMSELKALNGQRRRTARARDAQGSAGSSNLSGVPQGQRSAGHGQVGMVSIDVEAKDKGANVSGGCGMELEPPTKGGECVYPFPLPGQTNVKQQEFAPILPTTGQETHVSVPPHSTTHTTPSPPPLPGANSHTPTAPLPSQPAPPLSPPETLFPPTAHTHTHGGPL